MKLFIGLLFLASLATIAFSCDVTTCPSPNGSCQDIQNTTVCVCGPKYANDPRPGFATGNCTYEKREWLTALLLQIFLGGFGAGNFYTFNFQFAIPQLIFGVLGFFLPCVGLCVLCCCGRGSCSISARGCLGILVWVFMVIIILIPSCWWLADVIRYGMNVILDGNGVPLYKA